jgi:hypothetical protein
MCPVPKDHVTNTVEDAAAYEQWRGENDDLDNRPTRAEIEAEERGAR